MLRLKTLFLFKLNERYYGYHKQATESKLICEIPFEYGKSDPTEMEMFTASTNQLFIRFTYLFCLH